jgi:hypothetical protein
MPQDAQIPITELIVAKHLRSNETGAPIPTSRSLLKRNGIITLDITRGQSAAKPAPKPEPIAPKPGDPPRLRDMTHDERMAHHAKVGNREYMRQVTRELRESPFVPSVGNGDVLGLEPTSVPITHDHVTGAPLAKPVAQKADTQ